MDARLAVVTSAISRINGDSTLAGLLRGPTQDVRDPSRVDYWPQVTVDFVPNRTLRGVVVSDPLKAALIVVGDLVIYIQTNRDFAPTQSEEAQIAARIDRLLMIDSPTLADQTGGTQWNWYFGRTAPSDANKYTAGPKEQKAICAYAIVARGVAK
jgi:hypothetical protein